ncbi:MAG: serine/threonine protein kinase [Bacteroidales bacterium]|nr:serine/threonine protein kinase [Bacteroidales bacterium]
MSLYKIQGAAEKRQGIYYEFDPADEPLGVGGMGKVYKGRCVDETTHHTRDVAIKFMYSDLPPYAIEKARREAAIQFRHDNLIEMLGFIETESRGVLGDIQHHYHVVSELLTGVALDKLFQGKLTDQQGKSVPFAEKLFRDYKQNPLHFAVEIVKSVLTGLMTMHDNGYIHRDIDPTNIMITQDGKIKLIDFGIAKKMKSLTTGDKHLTQAGQFVGKSEYAAPEQILGAIDEQNQTTDIYAVGILLYQCITGHVPFEGDRADVIQKQVHSPIPLGPIKHKGLRKIIAKATEKTRQKRFQSAAEFRVALEQLDLTENGGFEWKPLYTYISGAVAACVIGVIIAMNIGGDDGKDLREPTYADAVNALHKDQNETALAMLEQLSEKGNSDATYLLSRLYFKSRMIGDYRPDSLNRYQRATGVAIDNHKAHSLLQTAVEQNPRNYQALYELACDYWKADQRTEAVAERNGPVAKDCFMKAKEYAQNVGDNEYVARIDEYLDKIGEWEENLRKLTKD